MPRDYYDILGVLKDADPDEVRRAFRKKARVLHPDINQSPTALVEFQELQEAYMVLKDPDKKQRYDQGEPVPVPTPPPPSSSDYRRKAWNTFAKYDPAYGYVDTDYAHYSRLSTLVGVITFLFATSFLVDFMFSRTQGSHTVISVKNKALVTKKSDDLAYVIVQTESGSFEKDAEEPELAPGSKIDLKRSMVYGFAQYRMSGEPKFRRVTAAPIFTYVLAVIVYLAALSAIFNKSHPERKFNAGIIASFFAVMLLAFALFG